MSPAPANPLDDAALRRRAEDRLRVKSSRKKAVDAGGKSQVEAQRLLHELRVYQIELEMQNAELRMARDQLENALETYTELYDFAPNGYFTLSPVGVILQANLTGAALLGIERSRLIGQSLGQRMVSAGRAEFPGFLKGAFAGPQRHSAEFELIRTDGAPQFVSIQVQRSADGLQAHASMSDVTGRRLGDNLAAQLAAIVQSSNDAIIGITLEGGVTSWNSGAERIFGYPADEMLRGSITRLHPPEYSGEHVRIMNRIALGENIGRFETVRIRSDGQRRQISKSISPIRNASGKIVGASLIASDITDQMVAERNRHQLEVMAASNKKLEREITRRKALEHDLRTSKRQLASLSREILLAQEEERKRISRDLHDTILQTLVGVSINLASLTQALDENPKKLRGKIDETQSDVEKLLATVHRFAVDLRPEVLEDLGLIPALHAFLKDFMKRTGVRVRLEADGSIAQLPSKLGFILYRVAMEALNNVGLHARATAVAVEIKILSDRVRMKITDDGQSFDVKRVQRAQGGARLGLLGMQERLKIVGGRFSIKSTPGRGTTVTAWIPVTLPTAKPAASVVP